jgi:hypothetical protein
MKSGNIAITTFLIFALEESKKYIKNAIPIDKLVCLIVHAIIAKRTPKAYELIE